MMQQNSLKALAHAVLTRNQSRNQSATAPQKARNFFPQKWPEKLREITPPVAGVAEAVEHPFDRLAESIAAEHGVTAAQCLSILDDDDREAIRTDSDPDRANAWRAAVESLLFRGEWKPAPPPEPVLVACETCAHAKPTGPGLIDCAALEPAPGACGPYRRWATDRYLCEAWEAAA